VGWDASAGRAARRTGKHSSDWRRRFATNALALTIGLVPLAVRLDPAAVQLRMANRQAEAPDALSVISQRARTRFGSRVPELWCWWSLISGAGSQTLPDGDAAQPTPCPAAWSTVQRPRACPKA
jgi:hypothetical protein